jgi:hypothetical protein
MVAMNQQTFLDALVGIRLAQTVRPDLHVRHAARIRVGAESLRNKSGTAALQARVYEQVIYIPLGKTPRPSAWRKSLTSVLGGPATPVFWNIDKQEGVRGD